MSDSQKQAILSCARGTWQHSIAAEFARYGQTDSPMQFLRGNAKKYGLRYESSFRSLLSRLRSAGFQIIRTAGKRGGEYSATYRISL